ncbi:MAG: tetratricopeptide repeat protein [Candidatus Omnitrophota bacterium]
MIGNKKIYLILAGICLLVYANSLSNAFVIDDIGMRDIPNISRPFHYWQDPVRFLNCLIYLIGGYSPFAYHLANIALHAAATILAFLFLRLFFTPQAAFLAACLFAVHPVNSEAVTWISGKAYTIFAIFTLGPYLLYRKATGAGIEERLRIRYYSASFILFFYFTIEHIPFYLVFPFFLFLSDVCSGKLRENLKWLAPFFIVVFVKLLLLPVLISGRVSSMSADMGFFTAQNPLTYFVYSLYAHFWLLLWPVNLSLFHEPYLIPASMFDWRSILYVLPVIISLVLTFKHSKRLFFGLCIFIMFLLPTYSPLPVSSLVAERYLYFPSIALSMAVAVLYERFSGGHPVLRRWFLAAMLVVIIFFSGRTIIRNRDWKDMRTVWESVLIVSPDSWNAHDNMGYIYLNEGRLEKAVEELEKAIKVNPRSAVTFNNLGTAYSRLGSRDKAILCFQRAIELRPDYAKARNNLIEEQKPKK